MEGRTNRREIERVEYRIREDMNRRFQDVKEDINNLSNKFDALSNKLENRLYEKHEWTVKELITLICSFVLGGGLIGAIQLFIEMSKK